MSYELLGETFDIHGGGNDLQFPHHENEIAQSKCAHPGSGFARYWLHNEMLQVEGKKMSKSLGNFFTVHDLLEQGVPGEVMRFVFLGTHYRKPMDWTEKKRQEAEATLRKWRGLVAGLEPADEVDELFLYHVANDLNTPAAITQLHRLAADVSHDRADLRKLLTSARVLGLLTEELGDWAEAPAIDNNINVLIDRLMSERQQARQLKDWVRADEIRDRLSEAGVRIQEGKDSYTVDFEPDFDPAKLEGL